LEIISIVGKQIVYTTAPRTNNNNNNNNSKNNNKSNSKYLLFGVIEHDMGHEMCLRQG